ncbi:MAG: hypothetical protein LBL81_05475 [Tannerella sp.]|jgi:hypothetical protein|nr:hypothetical protein [Tannerella sp.]
MSANTAKVRSVLENAFASAIKKLTENNEEANVTSDLYVQADAESGELQIFDEAYSLLEKVVVFDWVGSEEASFDKKVVAALKPVLSALAAKNAFEHPCFLKPFSVSLADEDFAVIEELLFLDDDTLRMDDPLLKNLDKDLDEFLDKLLSDSPK